MNIILTVGFTFFALYHVGSAMMCEHESFGRKETFNCPRKYIDDDDDLYCCGLPGQGYCCEADEFISTVGVGAIIAIVVGTLILIALVVLLCCCCCSGCYLYKRRHQRGVVLSTAQPKPTPQVNIYPNQGYTAVPYGYAPATQGQMVGPQYVTGYAPVPAAVPPPSGMYPAGGVQPPPYPNQPLPPEYSKPPPFAE